MTDAHDTWPASRFYWAVLDAPGPIRPGPVPLGLLPALADEVPEPLDDLHFVAATIEPPDATPHPRSAATSSARLLICGCSIAELKTLPPTTSHLGPDSVPAPLDIAFDTRSLNLLTGTLEPVPIRAARHHRHAVIAAVVALCSLLLALGLARRSNTAGLNARASRAAADALVAASVPDAKDTSLISASLIQRDLASALRKRPLPRDAAADAAALLHIWPRASSARPHSLSISSGGLALSLTLDGDAAPFLSSLRTPPGFVREEPRISSLSGLTRVNLQFRPGATP